jgi:hypothetical protein
MRVSPWDTVGPGVAVFTIARSALFAFATTTLPLALFDVSPGTMLVAVAVAVSAMLVPDAVPAFTWSTNVIFAVAFTARLAMVHVIVPVPPTGG